MVTCFFGLHCSQLNLLVATSVGEEGLDIQTCCLVIRFDLPETVASFIQSRGRARMPRSEYAFLVDRYLYNLEILIPLQFRNFKRNLCKSVLLVIYGILFLQWK